MVAHVSTPVNAVAACPRVRSPQDTKGECRAGLHPGVHRSSGKALPTQALSDERLLAAAEAASTSLKLFAYPAPPRLRGQLNGTFPGAGTSQQSYFKLERWLWQDYVPQRVWTDEPERADFFVVPHSLISFCFHPPLQRYSVRVRLKSYLVQTLHPWLRMIRHRWPYFNRSGGRDHLFVWVNDQGPELDNIALPAWDPHSGWRYAWAHMHVEREMIRAMLKVGYYGTTDAATASGWRDGVDVALPQTWMRRGAAGDDRGAARGAESWEARRRAKRGAFHFSGQTSTGTRQGCCSTGIRPWLRCVLDALDAGAPATGAAASAGGLAHAVAASAGGEAATGGGAYPANARNLTEAWFAPAPAGNGCWSRRLFHALQDRRSALERPNQGHMHLGHSCSHTRGTAQEGTVPVLLATGMAKPFQTLLDWRAFSIDVDTETGDGRPHAALAALRDGLASAEGRARAEAMARRGLEASHWFRWTAGPRGPLHSALGLFLVELMSRRDGRKGRGPGSDAKATEPSKPQPEAGGARECEEADLTTMEGLVRPCVSAGVEA